MTNWQPDLDGRSGPRYVAIADALAADLAAGKFEPGERLPTHRDLAWRLGVTVGTVSRAYAEAERRGLVSGEVGRGTYVRGRQHPESYFVHGGREADPAAIDLGIAIPPPGAGDAFLGPTLEALAKDPQAAALLAYQPAAGTLEHRMAGAEWLARRGFDVPPERVIVTNGGNHGIAVALAATTRPGDRVLIERLSYAVIHPIARMLGLRLEGVATDAHGMQPEALETACRTSDARALYCIPTLQNPTTAIMPEARRRAIAELAERHDLALLEDDIFARLTDRVPPAIASLVPERGYYLTSLSKTLAPGLRVGYLAGPAHAIENLTGAVRATCMMASPIPAEIASRWIRDGTAERILEANKRESALRRTRALDILGAWDLDCPPGCQFAWLHLPEPWRASDFANAAKGRGVVVAPAEAFAVGRREASHGVRIGLGPPRDRGRLEQALQTLAELLRDGPAQAFGSIV
jgi:DNA-binding transcriptional MocR family regulator